MSCSESSGESEARWMTDQLHPAIHSLRSEKPQMSPVLFIAHLHSFLPRPHKHQCLECCGAGKSYRDPLKQYNLAKTFLGVLIPVRLQPRVSLLKCQRWSLFPSTPNQTNAMETVEFLLVSNCSSPKSLPSAWFSFEALCWPRLAWIKSSNHQKVREPHTKQNEIFHRSCLSFRFVFGGLTYPYPASLSNTYDIKHFVSSTNGRFRREISGSVWESGVSSLTENHERWWFFSVILSALCANGLGYHQKYSDSRLPTS